MKKIFILLGALLWASVSHAAPSCGCAYRLDADTSQYTPLNLTRFPTVSNQTVSYKLVAANGVNTTYGAASSDALNAVSSGMEGDFVLPTSGTFAVEMNVESFLTARPSNSTAESIALIMSSGTSFKSAIYLYALPTGYNSIVAVGMALNGSNLAQQFTNFNLPLPGNYRLGLYVNMNTRQLGYTINGVNKGYLPAVIPQSVSAVSFRLEATTSPPANETQIGKTVKFSLITDGYLMTQPYPAGTVDICGNPA